MSFPPITLRYFNCHGRVQHIRHYLLAREIAFTDERIDLDEDWASWVEIKDDTSLAGPFHRLPVLQWGDKMVAERPVIEDWLHEKSGDKALLNEDENLQHAMLMSSCSSEVMMPLALLLYVELTHPGSNLDEQVQAVLPRLKSHFANIEETLIKWNWWAGYAERKIMLADCALWQQLWLVQHIFGKEIELETMPALQKFFLQCTYNEVFDTHINENPIVITARPEEAAAIERIQGCL